MRRIYNARKRMSTKITMNDRRRIYIGKIAVAKQKDGERVNNGD